MGSLMTGDAVPGLAKKSARGNWPSVFVSDDAMPKAI